MKVLEIKNNFESLTKKPKEKKNHIFHSIKSLYENDETLIHNIKDLVICLWNDPNIMYKIINHCDNNDLKNNIIPLLINNFYENIFSENVIENQLIYIIVMLIAKEINELADITEKKNFLDSGIINEFLKELIKKAEIQKYFKVIVEDVIKEVNLKSNENYLNNFNNDYIFDNKINLDVLNIEELITQKMNEIEIEREKEIKNKKRKFTKSIENTSSLVGIVTDIPFNNSNNRSNTIYTNLNIEKDPNIKNYFDDVTKSILENKVNNNGTADNIKEFCISQIKIMNYLNKGTNMEIYSNQTLLKHIYRSSISSKIFNVYQNFFGIIIDAINHLIENIQNNLTILPPSLKIICKAIVLLAKKKFGNNFTYIDSVYFFGKFFFNKLLLPFFEYPQRNCYLISPLLFTEEAYYNLEIISIIFNKLYSGNLFFQTENGGNLTPFNGFFLEKIPQLYAIYDDIMSINLPTNIIKLIDSKQLEEFRYDYNYFSENKNEIIYHQSCCISFNDILALLKTVNNSQDIVFDENFKKCYEKIINNKKNLNYILEKSFKNGELANNIFNIKEDSKDSIKDDKKDTRLSSNNNLEYIVINRVTFNKYNTKKIRSINSNFSYLNFDEIEEVNEKAQDKDKENIQKELIINNIKSSFCEILLNLPYIDYMLNKSYIKSSSQNNFISFLSDIKSYQKYLVNQIINLWNFQYSVSYLMDNLSNLPNCYSENNYELLIKEIKHEISESIKCLEFDTLSQFYNNFVNFELKQEISQIYTTKLSKVPIIAKIRKTMEQLPMFVKIKVIHGNNANSFDNIAIEIKKSNTNAKKMKSSDNIFIDLKRNLIVFKTLDIFAKNFSFDKNINYYINEFLSLPSKDRRNIFDYISKFNFSQKLIEFFSKEVRQILLDNNNNNNDNFDQNILNTILSKSYDYFMNNFYDSLYKFLPCQKDKDLSDKINKLSWTNLSHFIQKNANLYECTIQKIVNCFHNFEKTKIPSEKFFIYRDLVEISKKIPCHETIKYFNKEKNKEVLLNPIILYGIIKSKPNLLFSDVNFVQYFIQERSSEIEEFFDDQLPSYISYIQNLNYTNLYDINEDEFTIKCNEITLLEKKQ